MITKPKQRPIIFSGGMVRAILAGKKTQTRQVVKGVPASHDKAFFGIQKSEYHYDQIVYVRCPYGVVGDQLWVREGFRQELNLGYDKDGNWPDAKGMFSYFYKADCSNPEGWGAGVWKSPLFMPRAASRILLEITDIRVEQLRSITRGDAMAEGCPFANMQNSDPVGWYADQWESISGKKHPWSDNPWVWVIEFKRVNSGDAS